MEGQVIYTDIDNMLFVYRFEQNSNFKLHTICKNFFWLLSVWIYRFVKTFKYGVISCVEACGSLDVRHPYTSRFDWWWTVVTMDRSYCYCVQEFQRIIRFICLDRGKWCCGTPLIRFNIRVLRNRGKLALFNENWIRLLCYSPLNICVYNEVGQILNNVTKISLTRLPFALSTSNHKTIILILNLQLLFSVMSTELFMFYKNM